MVQMRRHVHELRVVFSGGEDEFDAGSFVESEIVAADEAGVGDGFGADAFQGSAGADDADVVGFGGGGVDGGVVEGDVLANEHTDTWRGEQRKGERLASNLLAWNKKELSKD